ncbi:MAG: hypothetical protein RL118_279 [Actinomycetota bacterium]|jgi:hypothetical protein
MSEDFGRDGQGGVDVGGTTLVEEEVKFLEPGDHERFSHFVRKEKIVESAVMGSPVTALCGKIWVPSRDPQKFPVCPTCKEIYEGLRPEPDGDDAGNGGSGSSGGAGE